MRKITIVLGLVAGLLALPTFAAEKLVGATATRMDPTPPSGRTSISIQNLGPIPIYCQRGTSTGLAVGKGTEITHGQTWTIGATAQTSIYCIAAIAQVTGAASIVEQGQAFAVGGSSYQPSRFRCYWTGTGTTRALITGCAAPGAGLAYHVEGFVIMGGVATGATAAALIESGTGGSCGSSTASVVACEHGTTGGCSVASPGAPLGKGVANGELCFTSGETGTKWVAVWGYIAP